MQKNAKKCKKCKKMQLAYNFLVKSADLLKNATFFGKKSSGFEKKVSLFCISKARAGKKENAKKCKKCKKNATLDKSKKCKKMQKMQLAFLPPPPASELNKRNNGGNSPAHQPFWSSQNLLWWDMV